MARDHVHEAPQGDVPTTRSFRREPSSCSSRSCHVVAHSGLRADREQSSGLPASVACIGNQLKGVLNHAGLCIRDFPPGGFQIFLVFYVFECQIPPVLRSRCFTSRRVFVIAVAIIMMILSYLCLVNYLCICRKSVSSTQSTRPSSLRQLVPSTSSSR